MAIAQVYYVPRRLFYAQVTLPTVFGAFGILRCVLLQERITIVHAHQAFSTMAHEATLHARTMGYKVVFTDHSLFGFTGLGSILANRLLRFTLADVHQVCEALCMGLEPFPFSWVTADSTNDVELEQLQYESVRMSLALSVSNNVKDLALAISSGVMDLSHATSNLTIGVLAHMFQL